MQSRHNSCGKHQHPCKIPKTSRIEVKGGGACDVIGSSIEIHVEPEQRDGSERQCGAGSTSTSGRFGRDSVIFCPSHVD